MRSRLAPARCSTLRASALVLVLVGCGTSERGQPTDEDRAAALTGLWTASFVTTRPFLGHDSGGAVSGHLVLMPTSRLDDGGGMPRPTHYGAFDVDYRPLGFQLMPAGDVPTLRAALTLHDSVLLSFGSDPAHTLVVRGQVSGDSIHAVWEYSSRAGGAAGSAELRRVADAAER